MRRGYHVKYLRTAAAGIWGLLCGVPMLAAQEVGATPDSVETVDRIVAVVGDTAILYSEIIESIVQAGAQGEELPDPGTPEFDDLTQATLTNLVDSRILLQKAKESDIQVPPEHLDSETDRRFREIRNSFPSATDFQNAVTSSGRSLVQYRQWLRGQVRSQMLIDEYVRANRDKLPPVAVTEEEIQAYFEENLSSETRPASISLEQVVIEPVPGEAARDSSIQLTEQILAELRDGKDFEVAARQYSMDMSNREQGGDLGWIQRSVLVPAFADAAWAARTGQPIGPVVTRFGYHIIRVDNVRGGERKIRHILIQPMIDETDFRRAGEQAMAVADSIREGAEVRVMAERHGVQEVPVRFPEIPYDQIGQFGEAYVQALSNPVPGSVIGPFQTEGFIPGRPVFAVVRITGYQSEGAWELEDIREQIRESLLNEKGYLKFIDELRNEVYVDIRL
ncbi:MAG: peptidylprolyl isomerase [marine benthic group bacterium]|nr:peptidylprolyl isomerase [Candidatus Benthicola marisminoris]